MLDLVFAIALMTTVTGMALPALQRGLDEQRTAGAARYLAGRLVEARMDAVRRSAFVGLRFEPGPDDYRVSTILDSNGNGLRTAELLDGVDQVLTVPEPLAWKFPGVSFGILPGVPDADGRPAGDADGVRVGTSHILSMNPNGSSSSGTLYVHGREHTQYAVRVLGATGRVRVVAFEYSARRWVQR
ncbi:MAG TPA: hypothetical protein VFX12_13200 [Vicinamibacterales bacterium]|nr:hypothetical protein [Vicinamibacterales bacterium]